MVTFLDELALSCSPKEEEEGEEEI